MQIYPEARRLLLQRVQHRIKKDLIVMKFIVINLLYMLKDKMRKPLSLVEIDGTQPITMTAEVRGQIDHINATLTHHEVQQG